jgi:hypothetical protein
MPLDPFFTASDKTLQDEVAERRLILSQTRKKPKHVKPVTHNQMKHANKLRAKLKSGTYMIKGGRALSGFKPPKKIWDEKN